MLSTFSLLCCFNLFSWDFNSPPPKFLLKVILPKKIKIKKAASYPFFFFFIPNGKLVKSQIKKQISMYSKKSPWKFSSERRRANVHHLTFRKQFMLLRYHRHIKYLIFLTLFLAAEYHSLVYSWETGRLSATKRSSHVCHSHAVLPTSSLCWHTCLWSCMMAGAGQGCWF